MPLQDEQAAVVDASAEAVKKEEDPGLYQLFLRHKISADEMEEVFEQVGKLPYGAHLIIWIASPGGSINTSVMFAELLDTKDIKATYISHLFNGSAATTLPQLNDALRLTYPRAVFTFHGTTFHLQDRQDSLDMKIAYSNEAVIFINERCREKVGLSKKEFKKYDGEDLILYGHQLLDIGENGWIDGLIIKETGVGQFLIKTRDGLKQIDVGLHTRADLKNLPTVE